ncbi:Mucin-like protein [Trichoplax sp. H2]|nr:Mucin-like protein [Trichoplax sp. H2]|eukprot:RDD39381.1 Mucin-like protein [Trichoplax sp. H2]
MTRLILLIFLICCYQVPTISGQESLSLAMLSIIDETYVTESIVLSTDNFLFSMDMRTYTSSISMSMQTSTSTLSSSIVATPSTASSTARQPTPTPVIDSGNIRPFSRNNGVPDGQSCPSIDIPQTIGLPFYGKLFYKAYICGNGMVTFNRNTWVKYPVPYGGAVITASVAAISPFWCLASPQQPNGSGTYYEKLTESALSIYSAEIRSAFNKTDYVASWGLQVTWENLVVDSTPIDTTKKNTFQVQILTDGTSTYALFRYPNNGIMWTLPSNYSYLSGLQIGFPVAGWGNGGSTYNNIFRSGTTGISQVVMGANANSGKQGYWRYVLTQNAQRPIEGTCRAFLAQPGPRSFPLRCPCSIGQAFFDWRFTFDAVSGNSRCFRSRFIRNGIARRCCYRGFGLGYGSYIIGPRNPTAGYVVQFNRGSFDHTGHKACCNQQTPVQLCVQFYNKYPSGLCRPSPRQSWFWGDPHFNTVDNQNYTFNGIGDFILLRNRTMSQTPFEFQARSDEVSPGAGATAFKAVGGYEGGSGIVEFNYDKVTKSLQLYYNKVNRTIGDLPLTLGSDAIHVLKLNSSAMRAEFKSGTTLQAILRSDGILDATVQLSRDYYGNTEGLLGRWDGIQNDFANSNGVEFPLSSTSAQEIHTVGNTWRVNPGAGILINFPPTSGSYQPKFTDNITFSSPELETNATKICGQNIACLFDAAVTNSLAIGLQSRLVDQTNNQAKEELDHEPPQMIVPASINVTVGSTVSFTVTASSNNGYSINFTISGLLPTGITFSNGSSNGSFVWNATSASPVSLTFIATDSRGRSSSVTPIVNMCNCTSNGQCMFNAAVGEAFAVVPCKCSAGYTGLRCENNIDACLANPDACYPGVKCTDQPPPAGINGFTCSPCPAGLNGNGSTCTDINECLGSQHKCNQTCVNLVGSYRCQCRSGYRLNADGKGCQDINECIGLNNCQQTCINQPGGFRCSCFANFILNVDGRTCRANNSCPQPNVCGNNLCHLEGTAEICTCKKGYRLTGPNTCIDINECLANNGGCSQLCDNTVGSFRCMCRKGYLLDSTEFCRDIDECSRSDDLCQPTQICRNTPSNYYCICRPGLVFMNGRCQLPPSNYVPPTQPPPNADQTQNSVQALFQYGIATQWNMNTNNAFKAALAVIVTNYCASQSQNCMIQNRSSVFTQGDIQIQPGYPKANGNNNLVIFYVNLPPSAQLVGASKVVPSTVLVNIVRNNSIHMAAAVGALRVTTISQVATSQPTMATTLSTVSSRDNLIIGLTLGIGGGVVLLLFAFAGYYFRKGKRPDAAEGRKSKLYCEKARELTKLNDL